MARISSDPLTPYSHIGLRPAFQAGAVAVLAKPAGMGADLRGEFGERLFKTLSLMSQARVVRRFTRPVSPLPAGKPDAKLLSWPAGGHIRAVAIGASTGGPPAIHRILTEIPHPAPVPILIVQHIAEGFGEAFGRWLESTGHKIVIPQQGDYVLPGHVYLAPDNRHMTIVELGRIALFSDDTLAHTPSVDALFESAARAYGSGVLAVLLTGMGSDGAAGMKALWNAGALTIAQDESTSTIFGMPLRAIEAGGVRQVLPLHDIGPTIRRHVS